MSCLLGCESESFYEENSISESLVRFEKYLDGYHYSGDTVCFDEVFSDVNVFDQSLMESMFKALDQVKQEHPISHDGLKEFSAVDSAIIESIAFANGFNIREELEYSPDELLVIHSYFERLSFGENAVELSKLYEGYVDREFSLVASKDKLMKMFGMVKWLEFYFGVEEDIDSMDSSNILKSSTSCGPHRDCVDRCICSRYKSYNFVDWVRFAVTGPADVLWQGAACGWSCF